MSTSGVRESIDVLAVGLVVFAGIAAISALVVLAFVIARLVALRSEECESWRALGFTRSQRAVVLAVPVLGATLIGTVLAVLAAWLASTLMPMGLARRAEPSPGLQFDALVLIGGAVAAAAVASSVVLLLAWRYAPVASAPVPARPSALGRAVESMNVGPSAGIGVRAALDPRPGRGAIAVRSTLVAATIAVVGLVSVFVFDASLDRLATTHALFGVGWDVAVDDTRAQRPAPDRPCSGLLAHACRSSNPASRRSAGSAP